MKKTYVGTLGMFTKDTRYDLPKEKVEQLPADSFEPSDSLIANFKKTMETKPDEPKPDTTGKSKGKKAGKSKANKNPGR